MKNETQGSIEGDTPHATHAGAQAGIQLGVQTGAQGVMQGALQRLREYARLVRLDKPVGSLLLLWPTLDALWLARGGVPAAGHLLAFVAGTVLMRSSGCALNDLADRNFDGAVRRTAQRPLAQGSIRPREALAVALVLALLAAGTLPLLPAAVFPYALVALALAAAYPYTKRFLALPQAFLGMAFSFGIPMAWVAERGSVDAEGWLFFAGNLFWVMAYDTEYAMVDREDDLRIGIRSSAITFGRADVAIIAACYAAYLAVLALLGRHHDAGPAYWLGWSLALALSLQHIAWIRQRDPAACLRAFRHNHWLGLAIFAGLVADKF
jgi:4-hydroxybenzoate polyprenyltransferase